MLKKCLRELFLKLISENTLAAFFHLYFIFLKNKNVEVEVTPITMANIWLKINKEFYFCIDPIKRK